MRNVQNLRLAHKLCVCSEKLCKVTKNGLEFNFSYSFARLHSFTVLEITTSIELQSVIADWKEAGARVGFVPTMGALHEGHIELVRAAQNKCDKVVVSVFVNPLQFNNPEDLEKYPRDIEGDANKLREQGLDVLFFPKYKEVYGEEVLDDFQLGSIVSDMEGAFRPGHFQGVAKVVHRFFELVQPDVAYFGEKDYQQVAVVRKMADLTGFKGEVAMVATSRETSGLAMSSRNLRLSETARENTAPKIHEVMTQMARRSQTEAPGELIAWGKKQLADNGFLVEYLCFAEAGDLRILSEEELVVQDRDRLFIAAQIEGVRLIDNIDLKV